MRKGEGPIRKARRQRESATGQWTLPRRQWRLSRRQRVSARLRAPIRRGDGPIRLRVRRQPGIGRSRFPWERWRPRRLVRRNRRNAGHYGDDLRPCAEPRRSGSAESAGPAVMDKHRGLSVADRPRSLPRKCVASDCLFYAERGGATQPYRPMINCISVHSPCCEQAYRPERISCLAVSLSMSGRCSGQVKPDWQKLPVSGREGRSPGLEAWIDSPPARA